MSYLTVTKGALASAFCGAVAGLAALAVSDHPATTHAIVGHTIIGAYLGDILCRGFSNLLYLPK